MDEFPTLEETERKQIMRALRVTKGNRTRAAMILGCSLRKVQRKLREWERIRRAQMTRQAQQN